MYDLVAHHKVGQTDPALGTGTTLSGDVKSDGTDVVILLIGGALLESL